MIIRRILRTVTVLASLVVAYQAYVLFAVPLLDPPIKERQAATKIPGEQPRGGNPDTQIQLLLSNYFPADHWTQKQPPIVFASSNEQAMLVIDDYKRHEIDPGKSSVTQVDITQFALLVFPTPAREGITPPRDAIVLEAPHGAKLKFDDFQPELGRVGQIIGGQFPGRITIRSDMQEEGKEDDLLIETADLEMNTKLLYSLRPVRFRMGQNVGGGRELEMSFLVDEQMHPKDRGLRIAGIDSLEIRRDVRMRLQLETNSLLPGDEATSNQAQESAKGGEPSPDRSSQPGGAKKTPTPVEATCGGAFVFDFVRYTASLDGGVELRQINANGPVDQLFSDKLELKFAPKQIASAEPQPVILDPSKRQQRDLGRLEPVEIQATGRPVIVNSPQENAQARGDVIKIGLKENWVRVEGAGAALYYSSNVLRAPKIHYVHPSKGSASPIGRFRASGPGTLHYVADPAKPNEVFQAAWQTFVELDRENGQPVLKMDGRPQFAFASFGSLTADAMKVYVRELHDAPADSGISVSTGKGQEKLQITPDRILAQGRVEIQSPQLTGRTGELFVTFRPAVPAAAGAAAAPAPAAPGSFASQFTAGPTNGASRQVFHIVADRMKLEAQAQGKSATPLSLSCDGHVAFREVPPPGIKEQPLEIRGAQLTVDRLDTSPYITLRGAQAAGVPGGGPELAQLAGRGVTMYINVLELDVKENRMWSDGPGKASLLVTRDLQGQAVTAPFPLDLTWQGGVQFDGSRVIFDRGVVVEGADDLLKCDRLAGKLNKRIVFGETIDQQAIGISEVECNGNVIVDHLTRDAGGVTSHERMQIAQLLINQQTGNISGKGPGVIRSTRFGDGLSVLAGAQHPATPQLIAPPPGAGSKLHFLRVDFHQGLSGNLITRELTFHERVKAVYGPVDSWEQELDPSRPETHPPDAMTMTCDNMRINEDPMAARPAANDLQKKLVGPINFVASGNVRIDGQTPKQGAFSAQADQARYEQSKDAFVLEGNGRTPATLWRAGQQGAPPSARRIRYVRTTGEVAVDGIQYLEILPGDIKNAQRPGAVR
jgi:hypothetical protein